MFCDFFSDKRRRTPYPPQRQRSTRNSRPPVLDQKQQRSRVKRRDEMILRNGIKL